MMKYEEVKTPEDLMKFMDEHIEYGFVTPSGKVYTTEDDEAFEYGVKNAWRVQDAKTIIEGRYGHCYDQVEVEREWFSSHGYEVKTYYILFYLEDVDHPYTTHTYLVFKDGEKYRLFEHSDFPNKGIWDFTSEKDAIYKQMEWHLKSNNRIKPLTKDVIESLHVYEYEKPEVGLDMYEFTDFVLDEGREIL